MVVNIVRKQIHSSKTFLEAAINDPTMIPESDKGKVRRRAAFIQDFNADKTYEYKLLNRSSDPFLPTELKGFFNIDGQTKRFRHNKAIFKSYPFQIIPQHDRFFVGSEFTDGEFVKSIFFIFLKLRDVFWY